MTIKLSEVVNGVVTDARAIRKSVAPHGEYAVFVSEHGLLRWWSRQEGTKAREEGWIGPVVRQDDIPAEYVTAGNPLLSRFRYMEFVLEALETVGTVVDRDLTAENLAKSGLLVGAR